MLEDYGMLSWVRSTSCTLIEASEFSFKYEYGGVVLVIISVPRNIYEIINSLSYLGQFAIRARSSFMIRAIVLRTPYFVVNATSVALSVIYTTRKNAWVAQKQQLRRLTAVRV